MKINSGDIVYKTVRGLILLEEAVNGRPSVSFSCSNRALVSSALQKSFETCAER